MENRQWKYLIVNHTDGTVVGTEQDKVAFEAALDADLIVIQMASTTVAFRVGEASCEFRSIPEQTWYKFD